jgi:tight adherence protein B
MAFVDYLQGILLMAVSLLLWLGFQKVPGFRRTIRAQKLQEKLEDVFPQTLGISIQALKTGQTMPQVLEYLSGECPRPLREEFSQVCSEMNLGSSAEEALSRMGSKFPRFLAFQQFLEAYKISRQTGANLTQLLEVLLEGLEEKNRILRKMNAMTAQARLSGTLMGVLPFLLAFVFFLMDPELMTPLFTEKAGWGILLLAGVLEAIGFLWIRQLMRLEV